MHIGIVRTVGSPCRCAEAVAKGLEALGHSYWMIDSEEITLRASEMARQCDLVIDHTDTFHGRGLFRPLVRHLLETQGSRMVGSDAKACFLADDKMTAKATLAKAGIPVPPGMVIQSKDWELPQWLSPPLVLKPAYEHMSRGLCLARTENEAQAMASDLLESHHQPVLLEKYISGRELAVSLLDGPDGLKVLPPLEWRVDGNETELLSEAFKLIEPVGERKEAVRADLAVSLALEKDLECLRAFEKVHSARPWARIVFAGPDIDGEYSSRFKKELKRLQSFVCRIPGDGSGWTHSGI